MTAAAPVGDLADHIAAELPDGPKPLRALYFDVETTPMVSFLWDLKADYVNPDMVIEPSFFLCWAAKWADSDEVLAARLTGPEAVAKDDRRIVAKLADLIRQADIVVAHNGDRFDLPKLNARIAVHELQPLGDVKTIDTLKKARSAFKFQSNRLGELAAAVGIDGKFPTSFDLWRRCMAGDVPALKEMDAYCRQDVIVLEAVFEALRPYVKGLPRLVDAGQYGQRVCPSCGSSDLTQLDKPYRTNANSYRKFRCEQCGRECRSFRQSDLPKLETRPL